MSPAIRFLPVGSAEAQHQPAQHTWVHTGRLTKTLGRVADKVLLSRQACCVYKTSHSFGQRQSLVCHDPPASASTQLGPQARATAPGPAVALPPSLSTHGHTPSFSFTFHFDFLLLNLLCLFFVFLFYFVSVFISFIKRNYKCKHYSVSEKLFSIHRKQL